MSHHSSIQGESDSEPEVILNSISTQLHSLLSSDSSDGDLADEDGDAFEETANERPVFLTARGPVSVISGQMVSPPRLLSSTGSSVKDVRKPFFHFGPLLYFSLHLALLA